MIPGRTLHRLAARICSAKALERVVEPAIADLQNEYFAALGGHPLACIRILLRAYVATLKVIGLCVLHAAMQTDAERGALAKTFAWSVAIMIAVTAILTLPPLWVVHAGAGMTDIVFVIPQAIPLAIPIGLTFGIALGLPGRGTSRAVTKAIMLIAFAASVASFGTVSWVMPAANQAFREDIAPSERRFLQRGASELTLPEVHNEMITAAARGDARRTREFAWNFHMRVALSCASLVLATLFLVSFGTRAMLRVMAGLVVCLLYWGLLHVGQWLAVYEPTIPAFAGAWLPNLVFAALTVGFASPR